MALARLAAVALDCSDPRTLADFWASLTGGEIVMSTEDHVIIRTDTLYLGAVRVPQHRRPTWPDGPLPKQIHLDLAVTDLDGAAAEAVRLGAEQSPHQPEPHRWRVMLDPAGHPFCLSTQMPD